MVAAAANMTSPNGRQALFQLGGATLRIDEQAMAVSHRNAEYITAINSGWADAHDTENQKQWTHDLWTANGIRFRIAILDRKLDVEVVEIFAQHFFGYRGWKDADDCADQGHVTR